MQDEELLHDLTEVKHVIYGRYFGRPLPFKVVYALSSLFFV